MRKSCPLRVRTERVQRHRCARARSRPIRRSCDLCLVPRDFFSTSVEDKSTRGKQDMTTQRIVARDIGIRIPVRNLQGEGAVTKQCNYSNKKNADGEECTRRNRALDTTFELPLHILGYIRRIEKYVLRRDFFYPLRAPSAKHLRPI